MTKHPARFTDSILERIGDLLEGRGWPKRILDPFAGTGRVHLLPHEAATRTYSAVTAEEFPLTVGVELEPEWAEMDPQNLVGNALHLPFPDASFDAMVTSPCYGNRFADSHNAQDGSRRRSYTHDLGRKLHDDNAGAMQWGDKYRALHEQAWLECLRVLAPDSLIVLNVSNHIRGGEEQHVAEWHMNWFMDHGCFVEEIEAVATPRLRDGANAAARVKAEYVFALRYVAPVLTPEEELLDGDDELDLTPDGTGMVDLLDATEGGDRP